MRHETLPPRLPPALAGLRAPCYLHQTPTWKLRALLVPALVAVVAGLGWVFLRLAEGRAGWTEGALGAFLGVFLVLLLRPSTWVPHPSLAADDRGLYFLGSDPRGPAVFVPWTEVGGMTVERVSAGGEGPAPSVVLTIADTSSFWDAAKRSSFRGLLLGSIDAEGRRRVPIGNQGLAADATRAALESLRGHRA